MRLEGRQPGQDFRSIIGDSNVIAIFHVETIGVVGKRASILILGAGNIKRIAIMIFVASGMNRNIISGALGLGGLSNGARSEEIFLYLELWNIV